MKKALDHLQKYRSFKKKRTPSPEQKISATKTIGENPDKRKHTPILNLLELFAVDLLDFWPMRKWRELCDSYPFHCWTATGCFWLAGQILAAHARFGLVYFILSALLIMFLNLGSRADGELSAYSVFNPGCERLLGQMTAEHFERDMLMVRRDEDDK